LSNLAVIFSCFDTYFVIGLIANNKKFFETAEPIIIVGFGVSQEALKMIDSVY
jgi:hypothetical protein